MSRVGIPLPDGTVQIVDMDDGRDAPWCDGQECYIHPRQDPDSYDAEHHVEPCPVYGTMNQAIHRLHDEAAPIVAAMVAELEKTRDGRAVLLYVRVRAVIRDRRNRLSWRLGRWRRRLFGWP